MAAATEESPAKVSCKTKNSTTVWLSGAAPGIYLKITNLKRCFHLSIHSRIIIIVKI